MMCNIMLSCKVVVLLGIVFGCSSFVVNLPTRFTFRLLSEKKCQSQLPNGFSFENSVDGLFAGIRPVVPKVPIKVKSIKKLKYYISKGFRVSDLDVRGDTKLEVNSSQIHPVVKALHERKIRSSLPGNRTDGRKIAIAVEGGGMRGCVGAGMITAFWYLGLQDSIDVVYGSSAGALVGAYFISGQLPHYGPEVYYDVLTSAGRDFIDLAAVLRSCGLGWLDLRPSSLRSLYSDRLGKPVLNLEYLFETIVQKIKPMDWPVFWQKQTSGKQVLKVVASGLLSGKAVVMSAENKNFQSVEELSHCMKASMLLPGITGEAIRLKGSQVSGGNLAMTWWPEYWARSPVTYTLGSEPLTDAQLYEPIPYRSALLDNCTHVISLRTKPDGLSVTKPMSAIERMIMTRFFGAKYGMPHLVSWMGEQYHKLVYAEDVLRLNAANRDFNDSNPDPKLFCVAVPKGTPEVKRLETSRRVIFESVRQGFAAAYDSLVLDPSERGKGMAVARTIWPDAIMLQPRAHLKSKDQTIDNDTIEEVVTNTAPDDDLLASESWRRRRHLFSMFGGLRRKMEEVRSSRRVQQKRETKS